MSATRRRASCRGRCSTPPGRIGYDWSTLGVLVTSLGIDKRAHAFLQRPRQHPLFNRRACPRSHRGGRPPHRARLPEGAVNRPGSALLGQNIASTKRNSFLDADQSVSIACCGPHGLADACVSQRPRGLFDPVRVHFHPRKVVFSHTSSLVTQL